MPLGFFAKHLSLARILPLTRFMATKPTQAWTSVAATSETPAHSIYSVPFEKSQLDDREYRVVRLSNNLEALLISDKNADKAAASLDVDVGHLSDPVDIPGCAHFCEHLLFMGTEQFPVENDYSQFISSNGGSTNAYTSAHNTNYYFSVNSGSLQPALHRFSTFFHSPLFSPSCTSRELNAVDSEHKKNHQSDTWRLFQLGKFLSAPGHPWSKFGSGNRKSLLAAGQLLEASRNSTQLEAVSKLSQGEGASDALQVPLEAKTSSPAPSQTSAELEADGGEAGRETRRRLVEWWKSQYCASRMKVAVLGKENIEELTQMVVNLFDPVPNRDLPPTPLITEPPLGPEQQGIIVYAKTIMDFKAIELVWSIPWQVPQWKVKPANFIGHFLGHEGPGSIHSYLKDKGWVTYLSAGVSGGAPGFDFFKITVVLTKEGFERHQEVLSTIYSYLSLLRLSSLPSWNQEEIQALSQISFRFKEKQSASSYVSRLSELAARPYPREKILSAAHISVDWDESYVQNLLNTLTADRNRVMVMAREGLEELGLPEGEWSKEKWYGTEFKVVQMSKELIEKAKGPNEIKELFLPGRNEFVPSNLEVDKKEGLEPLLRPLKISETPLSTLWYKKDDRFWVPKAHVNVNIVSPLASITPRHNLATRLFVDLVKDSLTEYSYDADLAGLFYNFANYGEGVQISVSGYNDKLPVLLKVVLEKIKGLVVNHERFAVLKEQLRQEYENLSMDQPYHSSDYYGRYLLSQRAWTPQEKLAELVLLSPDDVQAHIPQLLARVHIETLVHGNVSKDDAFNALKLVEDILESRSLTPSELISDRALLLPRPCNYIFEKPVPNKNDVNSALTYYFDIGDIAVPQTRAVLGLFAHIIHEPAFNQLRTKEQLGYIVSSGMWAATGSVGFRIVVQSEKNPIYLENRVDAFFDSFKLLLEEMTDEQFEQKKQGLISKKLEKWKNLGEEAGSFWSHLSSGYHDFRRREIDAGNIGNVTREDVMKLFMERIHYSSPNRSKLSIHLRSQASPSPKFSVEASQVLLPALQEKGVEVQVDDYHKLSAGEPSLANVQAFWSTHFKTLPNLSTGDANELLRLMEQLTRTHPSKSEGESGVVDTAAEYIRDVAVFKAGLTVSKAATPVEIYNDLSTSKL